MAPIASQPLKGLILGKFLPPHLGHQYLIDFARAYVDNLTVIVGTLKAEPIPGDLRFAWMKELFPQVNVVHLTDEIPQYPQEHPDFWRIWHDSIKRLCPVTDLLFASEDYGGKLASTLGATYIPVNQTRSMVSVTGTMIRSDPMKHWKYLPAPVRPYYVKKVCIVGPESTGKSTLAARLAGHYQTVFVHEYARDLLATKNNVCVYEDILLIARGQKASEAALSRQANRVLVCDTDLLTTVMWSELLFNKCPDLVRLEANRQRYDLYLVEDPNTPFIADPQRFFPDHKDRQAFFDRMIQELESRSRPWRAIHGTWDERFGQACQAIDGLLVPARKD